MFKKQQSHQNLFQKPVISINFVPSQFKDKDGGGSNTVSNARSNTALKEFVTQKSSPNLSRAQSSLISNRSPQRSRNASALNQSTVSKMSRASRASRFIRDIQEQANQAKVEQEQRRYNRDEYAERIRKEHSLKLRKVQPTPKTDIELQVQQQDNNDYVNQLKRLKESAILEEMTERNKVRQSQQNSVISPISQGVAATFSDAAVTNNQEEATPKATPKSSFHGKVSAKFGVLSKSGSKKGRQNSFNEEDSNFYSNFTFDQSVAYMRQNSVKLGGGSRLPSVRNESLEEDQTLSPNSAAAKPTHQEDGTETPQSTASKVHRPHHLSHRQLKQKLHKKLSNKKLTQVVEEEMEQMTGTQRSKFTSARNRFTGGFSGIKQSQQANNHIKEISMSSSSYSDSFESREEEEEEETFQTASGRDVSEIKITSQNDEPDETDVDVMLVKQQQVRSGRTKDRLEKKLMSLGEELSYLMRKAKLMDHRAKRGMRYRNFQGLSAAKDGANEDNHNSMVLASEDDQRRQPLRASEGNHRSMNALAKESDHLPPIFNRYGSAKQLGSWTEKRVPSRLHGNVGNENQFYRSLTKSYRSDQKIPTQSFDLQGNNMSRVISQSTAVPSNQPSQAVRILENSASRKNFVELSTQMEVDTQGKPVLVTYLMPEEEKKREEPKPRSRSYCENDLCRYCAPHNYQHHRNISHHLHHTNHPYRMPFHQMHQPYPHPHLPYDPYHYPIPPYYPSHQQQYPSHLYQPFQPQGPHPFPPHQGQPFQPPNDQANQNSRDHYESLRQSQQPFGAPPQPSQQNTNRNIPEPSQQQVSIEKVQQEEQAPIIQARPVRKLPPISELFIDDPSVLEQAELSLPNKPEPDLAEEPYASYPKEPYSAVTSMDSERILPLPEPSNETLPVVPFYTMTPPLRETPETNQARLARPKILIEDALTSELSDSTRSVIRPVLTIGELRDDSMREVKVSESSDDFGSSSNVAPKKNVTIHVQKVDSTSSGPADNTQETSQSSVSIAILDKPLDVTKSDHAQVMTNTASSLHQIQPSKPESSAISPMVINQFSSQLDRRFDVQLVASQAVKVEYLKDDQPTSNESLKNFITEQDAPQSDRSPDAIQTVLTTSVISKDLPLKSSIAYSENKDNTRPLFLRYTPPRKQRFTQPDVAYESQDSSVIDYEKSQLCDGCSPSKVCAICGVDVSVDSSSSLTETKGRFKYQPRSGGQFVTPSRNHQQTQFSTNGSGSQMLQRRFEELRPKRQVRGPIKEHAKDHSSNVIEMSVNKSSREIRADSDFEREDKENTIDQLDDLAMEFRSSGNQSEVEISADKHRFIPQLKLDQVRPTSVETGRGPQESESRRPNQTQPTEADASRHTSARSSVIEKRAFLNQEITEISEESKEESEVVSKRRTSTNMEKERLSKPRAVTELIGVQTKSVAHLDKSTFKASALEQTRGTPSAFALTIRNTSPSVIYVNKLTPDPRMNTPNQINGKEASDSQSSNSDNFTMLANQRTARISSLKQTEKKHSLEDLPILSPAVRDDQPGEFTPEEGEPNKNEMRSPYTGGQGLNRTIEEKDEEYANSSSHTLILNHLNSSLLRLTEQPSSADLRKETSVTERANILQSLQNSSDRRREIKQVEKDI